VRYTAKKGVLYLIVTKLPGNGMLYLPQEAAQGNITCLDTGEQILVEGSTGDKLVVRLPARTQANSLNPVIKIQFPKPGALFTAFATFEDTCNLSGTG
jgi:hypothetical protein